MYSSIIRRALVLVIAWSVDTAAQSKAERPGGCVLLSDAEFKAVTGEEVRNARPSSRDFMGAYQEVGCRYRGTNWYVEAHLERGRTADGVEQYMKTLKGVVKQTTTSDAKPISGLGDQAWWGPIDATNGMLHVVKGTDVLWVHTYGKDAPGAGSLEKTRALMDKVLINYLKIPKP